MRHLLILFASLVLVASACAGEPSATVSSDSQGTTTTEVVTTSKAITTLATTTTSGASTTTSTSTTATSADGFMFEVLSLGDAFGPADTLDLIYHDGSRWLVAGWRATEEAIEAADEGVSPLACWFTTNLCEGAVWQSADGIAWTQPTLLGPGADVHDMIHIDGRTIAVGTVPGGSQATEMAVWTSTGSPAWSRVETPGIAGTGSLRGVAADGATLVSVGASCLGSPCSNIDFEGTPTVWISEDGVAWEQVATPSENTGIMKRVVRSGDAWLAVGETGNPLRATVWTSLDGRDWLEIPLPVSPNPNYAFVLEEGHDEPTEDCPSVAYGLAASDTERTVVAGHCVPWNANVAHSTAWYSDDAHSWLQTEDPTLAFGGPAHTSDIDYTGDSYLAVGYIITRTSFVSIPTVWLSEDGTAWVRYSMDLDGELYAVASNAGQIIAVGNTLHGPLIVQLKG